jgi:tetratricopeptide (TPR) repeat protein
VIVVITAIAIRELRQRPYIAAGWFWFVGTLIPVIGLVQVGVQPRADRYTYIPLIGISIVVAWGMAEIGNRFLVFAAAIAGCAWCVVAWSQVAYWRNTVSLFERAVDVTRDNWVAQNALGQALLAQGRAADAIPHLRDSVRLRPRFPEARTNLGAALSKVGNFDGAAAEYRAAVELQPENADAQEGLGMAPAEKGELQEALAHLAHAVRLRPNDPDSHYNLGRLYGRGEGRTRRLRSSPKPSVFSPIMPWLTSTWERHSPLRNSLPTRLASFTTPCGFSRTT